MDLLALHNLSEPVRFRHWPFSRACRNNRDPVSEDRMKRLYQWISERASFFRSDISAQGATTTRTICTEVTVQREGMTLLVAGAAAGFDICPLCGQKVAPAQPEPASFHLPKASTSPDAGPAKGPSP
jgi:hypothetical protein